MGITFGRSAPKIWEGEKTSKILTTFDFDREYLWNGSTKCKSENNLINYNPFHLGRKYVNFDSQTKKF